MADTIIFTIYFVRNYDGGKKFSHQIVWIRSDTPRQFLSAGDKVPLRHDSSPSSLSPSPAPIFLPHSRKFLPATRSVGGCGDLVPKGRTRARERRGGGGERKKGAKDCVARREQRKNRPSFVSISRAGTWVFWAGARGVESDHTKEYVRHGTLSLPPSPLSLHPIHPLANPAESGRKRGILCVGGREGGNFFHCRGRTREGKSLRLFSRLSSVRSPSSAVGLSPAAAANTVQRPPPPPFLSLSVFFVRSTRCFLRPQTLPPFPRSLCRA